jgi:hypothetical protein
LREELEQSRADSRERTAVLEGELGQTRANLVAQTMELEELSRAAAAVSSFTFGTASAGGSSMANRLVGVPDVLRRSITEGMLLRSYLTLMNTGGLYENLDLGAIGQGCPSIRPNEEMAALDQAVRECARTITSRVPIDVALEAARNP